MSLSYGGELPQVRSVINCFFDWDEFNNRRVVFSTNTPPDAYIAPYQQNDADCMSIKAGDALWKWKNRRGPSNTAMPFVWGNFNGISVMRSKLNDRNEPDDFARFYNYLVRSITFIGVAVTDYAFDPNVRSGGPSGGIVAARSGTIKVLNVGPGEITPGCLIKVRPPKNTQPSATNIQGYPRHRAMSEYVVWHPDSLFETRDTMLRYFRIDSTKNVNDAHKTRTQDELERRNYPNETAERLADFIKLCAFLGVHVLKAQLNDPNFTNAVNTANLEKVFGLVPQTVTERNAGTYRLDATRCRDHLNQRDWQSVDTDTALLSLAMGVTNDRLVGTTSIDTRTLQQGGFTRFLNAWQDVMQRELGMVAGVANTGAKKNDYFMLHLRAAIP